MQWDSQRRSAPVVETSGVSFGRRAASAGVTPDESQRVALRSQRDIDAMAQVDVALALGQAERAR
jgi:hypothetical protein